MLKKRSCLLIAFIALILFVIVYLAFAPRLYSYWVEHHPDRITVEFNQAQEIEWLLFSEIAAEDKGNGSRAESRRTTWFLKVRNSPTELITLNAPNVSESEDVEWEFDPIIMKPGRSYAVGWHNDPYCATFDMTTSGPMNPKRDGNADGR